MGKLLEIFCLISARYYGILFKVGKSPVVVLNENIASYSLVGWIASRSTRSGLYSPVVKTTEDSILLIQVNFFRSLCHSAELVREVYLDKAA